MALRRQKTDATEGERWLEVSASMTGTLAFKDPVNLQINGRFDGTLEAKGNLAVGEKAEVKATIHAETITIGGTVNGDITATRRVELLATARVSGKTTTPRLIMQDGALFNGTVDMAARPAEERWMGLEELARFLEMDAATLTEWAQGGRLPAEREGGQWRFDRIRIEEWLAREKIR